MTVAIPCSNCGRSFAAGHGSLCGDCRPEGWHAEEVRIPDTRGQKVTPLNDAAREQMRESGEPFDPDESEALARFLGLE